MGGGRWQNSGWGLGTYAVMVSLTQTHIYTHTHTYIHTHIHTLTHTNTMTDFSKRFSPVYMLSNPRGWEDLVSLIFAFTFVSGRPVLSQV